MNTPSFDTQLEQTLGTIELKPSQRFYKRMEQAAWTAAGMARRRMGTGVGLTLVLAAALMAFTPQGRSLAQAVTRSFLGYFRTTGETKLLMPATPAPIPTYSFHPILLPFEPQTTPAADPAQCGPTISDMTSSAYCLLLNAQAEVGFDLKGFGSGDLPLLADSPVIFQNTVGFNYFNLDGTESFYLTQGKGDFLSIDSNWGLVPSDSVRQVVVGTHPGELVIGAFENTIGNPTINWTTWLPEVHLRWQEGEHWYSIDGMRLYWNSDSASQKAETDHLVEELITLGQNLTPLSSGVKTLAGHMDQTPEDRVGFHFLAPSALPERFALDAVRFGTKNEGLDGTVELLYSFTLDGKWVGGISIYEAAVSNQAVDLMYYFTNAYNLPKYLLEMDEPVQIGDVTGRYMVKPDGTTALIWQKDGIQFSLHPAYAEAFFGGRMTRETLVAIAESMK